MIAFIFPGQGSQAVGMGKALAEAYPAARETFAEADEALVGHLFAAMRQIAAKLGLAGGYRVTTNCGRDAGQE
ncbi:MAG TPA: hypothetical protein PKZ08_16010, partial [Vicinamibacterales bacterium]|nr:hypothetical protein [Vicinamibacterales bacterium]